MANPLYIRYIRCERCNVPLTSGELFSNFTLCDYCDFERDRKDLTIINPYTCKSEN